MKTILTKLIIVFLFANVIRSFASDEVERFAAKYKKAKGEIHKRAVCLEFIDAGLLYDGAPMADVRKVFKSDFEEQGMGNSSNRIAIVRFVRPRPSPSPPNGPTAQADLSGWYLALTYRPDGRVMHYSLSNEGKARPARRPEDKSGAGRTNEDPGLPVVEPPTAEKSHMQPK